MPIVLGKKGLKNFLPLIIILLILLFSLFFDGELQNSLKNLLAGKILLEFSNEGYEGLCN